MGATLKTIVPMIPAGPHLRGALSFFEEKMGFTITWESSSQGIAGIQRDSVAFTLIENDNQEWANNASFSISVDDLDALYDEFKDISVAITPLEIKPWGRREFHMIVPSGVCLQ
ncbi:MAG TPA: VOC family protein, partial [Candidatus Aquilonibacter sp.]